MNKLKVYQKFQLVQVSVILKKIVDFQNDMKEFRCLVSLGLNCGTIITGYPVQVSCGDRDFVDILMIKDKIDEDLIYVLMSAISTVRVFNAPEFIQVFSSGQFLAPIKKEEQITRFQAKRLIQQAWEASQLNFSLAIDWEALPADDDYNNYLKDTVDDLVRIFKEIAKDELGRSSLKSISEFKLEYTEGSEIKCFSENSLLICRFNLQTHATKFDILRTQIEALL